MKPLETLKSDVEISSDIYSHNREVFRTSKQYLLEKVCFDEPKHILDLGCGTGVLSQKLIEMGHSVRGVDYSPEAIAQYNEYGLDGSVCDVSLGLPFDDSSFDVVFSSEVIEHVVNTEAFVGEVARVLKPGGKFIFSTPNSAFWVFRVYALLGKTLTEVQHPGHVRFFSKATVSSMLAAGGFVDVEASSRNIYLIFNETGWRLFDRLAMFFGFKSELRVKTQKNTLHLSGFSKRASNFWGDTFLVSSTKK